MCSLDRLVVDVLFDSLLGDKVYFDFLSDLRDVFCDVFYLLVVGVSFFDWDVVGLSDCLILSYSSGDWNVFGSLLGNLFDVLSLVRDLDVTHLGFVVSVSLLYRDVLNVRLGLGLGLLENSRRGLNYTWLSLNYRLH